MRWVNKILYLVIAIGAYVIAFNDYVPSDITAGLWLTKPAVIITIAVIVIFFIAKRVASIWYFGVEGARSTKLWLTLLLLPSYLFIALFITIDASGLLDNGTRKVEWPTNLVFFKDVKVACIIAGIDDAQINAGDVSTPNIWMVPRRLCSDIGDEVKNKEPGKHAYILTLSAGRLGIPYITKIVKAADPQPVQ